MRKTRLLYVLVPVQILAILVARAVPADTAAYRLARISPYLFAVTLWLVATFMGIWVADMSKRLPAGEALIIRRWGSFVSLRGAAPNESNELAQYRAVARPVLVAYALSVVLVVLAWLGVL